MAGRDTFELRFAAVAASAAVLIFLFSSQAVEASRMLNLCSHTAYPSLCQPLVKRVTNPRRATHQTIQALEAKTKLALTEAARYKSGNQEITTCYETFTDALYNLANARKSIRKRNVMAMNTFLTAAVSDFGVCVEGFIDKGQVNTVQNAAVDLRKIGTNCLMLYEFIVCVRCRKGKKDNLLCGKNPTSSQRFVQPSTHNPSTLQLSTHHLSTQPPSTRYPSTSFADLDSEIVTLQIWILKSTTTLLLFLHLFIFFYKL